MNPMKFLILHYGNTHQKVTRYSLYKKKKLSSSHNSANVIFSIKNNDISGKMSYTSNCSFCNHVEGTHTKINGTSENEEFA